MPPSTSSRLRQGPTHVTDTGRCPTPCLNLTEVARLGQLSLCCSRLGASPSSRACSVLIPALRLSRTAVCAATELSVRCSQDLSDLRTPSVLRPNRRGEPVVTLRSWCRPSMPSLWMLVGYGFPHYHTHMHPYTTLCLRQMTMLTHHLLE